MSVLVLTEDFYGRQFIRTLVGRLKARGAVPGALGFDYRNLLPDCNRKLDRLLRANPDRDAIVVLLDADLRPPQTMRERVGQHVPPAARAITKIVVLRTCVEEWVCVGLGLAPGDRPVEVLAGRGGYRKSDLPSFAPRLDLTALDGSATWREFVAACSPRVPPLPAGRPRSRK